MKAGITHLVKDILELVLGQGAALDVFDCAQLLGHPLAILFPHGVHLLLGELGHHLLILPQIHLGADDEAGHAGAVVVYLGEPLLADVFERGGRRDAEANEEDVGLGIRERSQAVVIFLPGGIEQSQRVGLVANPKSGCLAGLLGGRGRAMVCLGAMQGSRAGTGIANVHDRDSIVVKDRRDVFRGEFVCGVANKETCLADRTVTDNHAPGRGIMLA